MNKIILWGTGRVFSAHLRRIQYGCRYGEFEVLGVTSNDDWYQELDGFPFIPKAELVKHPCDYILVANRGHLDEIREEYVALGGERAKVLSIDVLDIPRFTFDQYIELYRSKISIISNNCWGGVTYHALHLPFESHFINMFETDEEYLELLRDFEYKIRCPLEYVKDEYNEVEKITYPVFSLDGTLLHMNHYPDRKQAERKWKERLQRLNPENLFFMMYTESKDAAKEFERLPYEKKVCFTSFPSSLPSAMYVRPWRACNKAKGTPFWDTILGMADGRYPFYDAYELLMHGAKVYRVRS